MDLPIDGIESLVLFGSAARGDADEHSDVDICAFVHADSHHDLVVLKMAVADNQNVSEESVTIFTVTSLQIMVEKGALFLWHIRLEGKILQDENDVLKNALSSLEQFEGYAEELAIYSELMRDIDDGRTEHEGLSHIDLHILFLVIRNVSVLLCFKSGTPNFGRTSAYDAVRSKYPEASITREVFDQLEQWHLVYKRGIESSDELPNPETSIRYVGQVMHFLELAEETLC